MGSGEAEKMLLRRQGGPDGHLKMSSCADGRLFRRTEVGVAADEDEAERRGYLPRTRETNPMPSRPTGGPPPERRALVRRPAPTHATSRSRQSVVPFVVT